MAILPCRPLQRSYPVDKPPEHPDLSLPRCPTRPRASYRRGSPSKGVPYLLLRRTLRFAVSGPEALLFALAVVVIVAIAILIFEVLVGFQTIKNTTVVVEHYRPWECSSTLLLPHLRLGCRGIPGGAARAFCTLRKLSGAYPFPRETFPPKTLDTRFHPISSTRALHT